MSTLTAFADMSPVPRVLVDVPVEDFPAGSVTVSLLPAIRSRANATPTRRQTVRLDRRVAAVPVRSRGSHVS